MQVEAQQCRDDLTLCQQNPETFAYCKEHVQSPDDKFLAKLEQCANGEQNIFVNIEAYDDERDHYLEACEILLERRKKDRVSRCAISSLLMLSYIVVAISFFQKPKSASLQKRFGFHNLVLLFCTGPLLILLALFFSCRIPLLIFLVALTFASPVTLYILTPADHTS